MLQCPLSHAFLTLTSDEHYEYYDPDSKESFLIILRVLIEWTI